MKKLHRPGRIDDAAERSRCQPMRFIRQSLFGTIVLWVVLALLAFTLLGWLWGEGGLWSPDRWLTNWRGGSRGAGSLDLIKVSLTTIGGIGAVAYLVIKYRERAASEHGEADDRLLTAIQQLGSESPSVRIAGVYALADVADVYQGVYRQRVVNILCGYLRTERGHWELKESVESDAEAEPRRCYVTSDGAVESTILEVFRQHFRKARKETYEYTRYGDIHQEVEDNLLWCDCRIDLHGATLTEMVKFSSMTFDGIVDFYGATFCQITEFSHTVFASEVKFDDAVFNNKSDFSGAVFRGHPRFQNTTFTGMASFLEAKFKGPATFKEAIFSTAPSFRYAHFAGIISFQDANVTDETIPNFNGAKFNTFVAENQDPSTRFPSEFELDNDTGLPPGAQCIRFKNGEPVFEIVSKRITPQLHTSEKRK